MLILFRNYHMSKYSKVQRNSYINHDLDFDMWCLSQYINNNLMKMTKLKYVETRMSEKKNIKIRVNHGRLNY